MSDLYAKNAERYDETWHTYLRNTVKAVLPEISVHPGASILDFGCGTGEVLFRYMHSQTSKKHPFITGYDPSPEMLKKAQEKIEALDPELQKRITLTTSIPRKGGYECIICTNVLHYFKQPEKKISYFYELLQQKGTLILLDFSKESFMPKRFEWLLRMIDRQHIRTYLPHEAKVLLEDGGFETILEKRIPLDTWWNGFLLVGKKR